jgi:ribosomal protein S18
MYNGEFGSNNYPMLNGVEMSLINPHTNGVCNNCICGMSTGIQIQDNADNRVVEPIEPDEIADEIHNQFMNQISNKLTKEYTEASLIPLVGVGCDKFVLVGKSCLSNFFEIDRKRVDRVLKKINNMIKARSPKVQLEIRRMSYVFDKSLGVSKKVYSLTEHLDALRTMCDYQKLEYNSMFDLNKRCMIINKSVDPRGFKEINKLKKILKQRGKITDIKTLNEKHYIKTKTNTSQLDHNYMICQLKLETVSAYEVQVELRSII